MSQPPQFYQCVIETKRDDCNLIQKACPDCDEKHDSETCYAKYFGDIKWRQITVIKNQMYVGHWHHKACEGQHDYLCLMLTKN
jgi:hypothetical protein